MGTEHGHVLQEAEACQVHALLSGEETGLGGVLEAARAATATGSVEWQVPVTPATVHRLGALELLAAADGVSLRCLPPIGLNAREAVFHDDYLASRPAPEGAARRHETAAANMAVLRHGARILRNVGSLVAPPIPLDGGRLERVVLVGQYGGEHVGDAAILGGVLLRLHRDYGTTVAFLMSWRPDHTRQLASRLETPVQVIVESPRDGQVQRRLNEAQALVFAGGPVMDLPRVLAMQMAVATAARRKKLPIVCDRIGIGPFKRRVSRVMARRLLRLASRLSVRASAGADDPVVAGLHPVVETDPAFEYLATRHQLSRLQAAEQLAIDALLQGTEGRPRIGINLRPIRHLWSPRGSEYSRRSEERFLDRVAAAMVAHAERSTPAPCYVFFPMNPQEGGCSDLRSAYHLHRRVGGRAEIRVWEQDPDVDGILYLLRQLDAVVAMRLHACIFAWSQQRPTLGIDYYPGQGGKVEQLFRDAGRLEDVCRMDTVSTATLTASLSRLTAAGP